MADEVDVVAAIDSADQQKLATPIAEDLNHGISITSTESPVTAAGPSAGVLPDSEYFEDVILDDIENPFFFFFFDLSPLSVTSLKDYSVSLPDLLSAPTDTVGANANIPDSLRYFFGKRTVISSARSAYKDYMGINSTTREDEEEGEDEEAEIPTAASPAQWSQADRVIINGFLKKKPERKDGRSAFRGGWSYKRRWCVLRERKLAYFSSQHSAAPINVLTLEGATIDTNTGSELSFRLRIASAEKDYIFEAEDTDELTKWVAALRRECSARASTLGIPALDAPSLQESMISRRHSELPQAFSHLYHAAAYSEGQPWGVPSELRLCNRRPVSAFKEVNALQFSISCVSLAFESKIVEPFFCTLCVYDVAARHKVTEDFHFDLNEKAALEKSFGRSMVMDAISRATNALFSISRPNSDMYLVLIIDKVLQNQSLKASKPYLSIPSSQQLERFQAKVDRNVRRFFNFRQPFAWSFLRLFDPLTKALVQGDREFDRIFRLEGDVQSPFDVFEFIGYVETPEQYTFIPKTLKELLRGAMKISVKLAKGIPPDSVDSMLRHRDSSAEPTPSTVRCVQEITKLAPLEDFVNLMYVYPLALNMVNKLLPVSVAVQAELRDTDASLESSAHSLGQPLFFGRSSTKALANFALSSVSSGILLIGGSIHCY